MLESIKTLSRDIIRRNTMRVGLFFRSAFLFLCILGLSATAAHAEAAQLIFCKSFSDSWEPQDQTETFDSNVITWIAKSQEPFDAQQLSLSIPAPKNSF
jgi:hypothetical protein